MEFLLYFTDFLKQTNEKLVPDDFITSVFKILGSRLLYYKRHIPDNQLSESFMTIKIIWIKKST